MIITHSLGFPRIGIHRDMKFAVESYWGGEISVPILLEKGKQIRRNNWAMQAEAGLNLLPVGDFSWYDHMLDMSMLLGAIPKRYETYIEPENLTTCFRMARGDSLGNHAIQACEMTKWFDTNYHYIVPELEPDQQFELRSSKLFDEIDEALSYGYKVKPILIGPLTFLWLGKSYGNNFNKLTLLPQLLTVYQKIISKLEARGIEWVQMDEPLLVLDLPKDWQNAFQNTYQTLQDSEPKIMLTTYFGGLEDNLELVCQLPVSGIHIDAVRAPEQIAMVLKQLPADSILSLGVINGRNIWKADLQKILKQLNPVHKELGNRLWIGGSCSFLHCPVDLDIETKLTSELKQWMAFAKQKTQEIVHLAKALSEGEQSIEPILLENRKHIEARKHSAMIHNQSVQNRCELIGQIKLERSPYPKRHMLQNKLLNLPLFPTTTIGSFPQTPEIRLLRRDMKSGAISIAQYENSMKQLIQSVIEIQEQIGLDVLVHGEAERNDMVEYFGEQLDGFAFTQNGWIQSYGSRCVKPPIIYGCKLP